MKPPRLESIRFFKLHLYPFFFLFKPRQHGAAVLPPKPYKGLALHGSFVYIYSLNSPLRRPLLHNPHNFQHNSHNNSERLVSMSVSDLFPASVLPTPKQLQQGLTFQPFPVWLAFLPSFKQIPGALVAGDRRRISGGSRSSREEERALTAPLLPVCVPLLVLTLSFVYC